MDCDTEAWNNFVMKSDPFVRQGDSDRRAAAIAASFMALANNGGLNHFLEATYELGSKEAVEALRAVGALLAAEQLEGVIRGLGGHLPPSSQEERWDLLEEKWSDELDCLESVLFRLKHLRHTGAGRYPAQPLAWTPAFAGVTIPFNQNKH